jgi:anti-anti-sigma factor
MMPIVIHRWLDQPDSKYVHHFRRKVEHSGARPSDRKCFDSWVDGGGWLRHNSGTSVSSFNSGSTMSSPSNPCVEHSVDGSNVVVTILETHMRDQEKVNQIREALLSAVAGSKAQNAIIDLVRVQFIGSIGFLAFLALRRAPGIEQVILCNLSDNLRELFSICRLIPTPGQNSAPFLVAPNVPDALELVSKK